MRLLIVSTALAIVLSACTSFAPTPAPFQSAASPSPTASAGSEPMPLPAVTPAPPLRYTPLPQIATSPSPTSAPVVTAAPTPTTRAAPVPTPASQTPTDNEYLVVAGDTLYSIARRFGITTAQLQQWNADRYPELAANPNYLRIGWRLRLSGEGAPSTPPSSDCSAGNAVADDPQIYRTIPGAGNKVALTFDMGGRLDGGAQILQFLVANNICATIFPTGAMAQTAEGQRIMSIIANNSHLLEIGNHTMHHCDLIRGGQGSPTTAPCQTGGAPSREFIIKQLADAESILRNLTGQDPRPFWRPPYGAYDQRVIDAASAAGYGKTFMWDIDTIDWKPTEQGGPTAEQMAVKVINAAVPGSNVLMHLGGYHTLEALRLMVPALRDRGFMLTSLSDMLP